MLILRLIQMEWVPADHNTGEVELNIDVTFAFENHYGEVPKYVYSDEYGKKRISLKTEYIHT